MPLDPAEADDVCQWFAACFNAADYLMPHPILGPVPICTRCADRVNQMRNER